jgi:hypothetical protein
MPLPAFEAGDAWQLVTARRKCLSVCVWPPQSSAYTTPLMYARLHELGLEGKVRRVTQRHNRRLRFDIRVARGMFRDALAALVAKSVTGMCGPTCRSYARPRLACRCYGWRHSMSTDSAARRVITPALHANLDGTCLFRRRPFWLNLRISSLQYRATR